MWLTGEAGAGWLADGWVVACIAAGEIIDRLEFYAELDVPTPKRQIAHDLAVQVAGVRTGGHPG